MIEGLYVSQSGPASLIRPTDVKMASHDEHANKEKTVRLPFRPPRRAQSTHDYVYPTPPAYAWGDSRSFRMYQSSTSSSSSQNGSTGSGQQSASSSTTTSVTGPQRPPTIHEEHPATHTAHAVPATTPVTPTTPATPTTPLAMAAAAAVAMAPAIVRPPRPKLPPPRRSYSVQDYEPVPPNQLPSVDLTLEDLPPELHYAIFDYLDPIDSTCLGLTNKHFYEIHRRMHGTISLSARRSGPNDMEWVWHLASRMVRQSTEPATATNNALAMLRVQGQALCRKCGVSRCELHKHIESWMGPEYEYCTVREKFGPPAPAGAKDFCYLSNPKDPHRCGRHRVPKSRPPTPEHKKH